MSSGKLKNLLEGLAVLVGGPHLGSTSRRALLLWVVTMFGVLQVQWLKELERDAALKMLNPIRHAMKLAPPPDRSLKILAFDMEAGRRFGTVQMGMKEWSLVFDKLVGYELQAVVIDNALRLPSEVEVSPLSRALSRLKASGVQLIGGVPSELVEGLDLNRIPYREYYDEIGHFSLERSFSLKPRQGYDGRLIESLPAILGGVKAGRKGAIDPPSRDELALAVASLAYLIPDGSEEVNTRMLDLASGQRVVILTGLTPGHHRRRGATSVLDGRSLEAAALFHGVAAGTRIQSQPHIWAIVLTFFLGLRLRRGWSTRTLRNWFIAFACISALLVFCSVVVIGVYFHWIVPLICLGLAAANVHLIELRYQISEERRKREEDLRIRTSLESIEKTVKHFAHDVRQPFQLLRSVLHTLTHSEHRLEADFLDDALGEVDGALSSVEAMIRDFMGIGKQEPTIPDEIFPEDLIKASLKQAFGGSKNSDVILSYDFQHLLPVLGNKTSLVNAVTNIIQNAVEAMEYRGRLGFSTRERLVHAKVPKTMIEISIKNTGSFIPQSLLDRVFDPYFTSGKAGGTGLGLSIVKRAVSEHGGSIWVDSSEVEKTVEFTILLPPAYSTPRKRELSLPDHSRVFNFSSAASRAGPDLVAPNPGVRGKALFSAAVVDDNGIFCAHWESLLQTKGFEVKSFNEPESFWHYAESNGNFLEDLDILITDYYFDEASRTLGTTLAREVKERRPDLIIVLATSAVLEQRETFHVDFVVGKDDELAFMEDFFPDSEAS